MEKTKKKNWPLKILGLLFVLYLSLTIAMEAGYYEAILQKKSWITNDAMAKFEQDVKEGKEVDINDYITDVHKDFSNGATKAGVAFSSAVEEVMSNGITEMVNIFKKLFT